MSNAPPSIEYFHYDPHWHQVFFPIRQDSIALESCSTIVVVTNTSEKEQKQIYRIWHFLFLYNPNLKEAFFISKIFFDSSPAPVFVV